MLKRMIWPLVLGLLGAGVFLWLGVWQVERLAWKAGVLAEIDAQIAAAPQALPDAPDEARDQFLPVALSGRILGDEITILASLRDAGPVFRIIRGFETEDGRRVLVDFGFVRETDRDVERPGGPARITGNLHWPDEMDSYTPEPDLAAGIWFGRDIPAMAAFLGTEPVLVVLSARPEPDIGVQPFPLDSSVVPNDHLAYAVTWFLLAFAWMGMTAFLLWRISKRTI